MNYTTGTITLTNGSTAVTGNGTGWATALIAGGVIYPQAAGNPLPIASIDNDTAITAATEWVGATGTYAYALQRQDDANQVIANAAALADYIQRLDNATLSAFAGLTPAADKLAYFSGTSTAALTTLTSFARSLLDGANASAALTTLGVSTFAQTLLNDTDAEAARETLGASLALPGQVGMFAMSTAPTGWLKANGATLSRATYADLFTAIGTTFGAGDGSTTFKLPDLRGEFLRVWDDGRGIDGARPFGSSQGDAIRNITGNGRSNAWDQWDFGGAFATISVGGPTSGGGSTSPDATWNFDASRVVPTADENRPRNIALLACIKY